MSISEAIHTVTRRTPRLWIVETLIVIGVLAFGYFAVTMDSSFLGIGNMGVQSADPISELLR